MFHSFINLAETEIKIKIYCIIILTYLTYFRAAVKRCDNDDVSLSLCNDVTSDGSIAYTTDQYYERQQCLRE